MNKLFMNITTASTALLLCVGVESAAAEEATVVTEPTESVTLYERVLEYEESSSNLQRVGCVVPVSFVVHVPNSAFTFDNARVYTPVMVNGDWREELPAMIVKGHSYNVATADEVTAKEDYADSTEYYLTYQKPMFKSVDAAYEYDVKYKPELRGAKLILEIDQMEYNRGLGDGKTWWKKDVGEIEDIELIQYGVIDFSHLKLYDQTLYLYEDKVLEENFDNKSVFTINSDKVQANAFNKKFQALVSTVKDLVADDIRIKTIDVAVSASLDGPYDKNEALAIAREDAIKKIMEDKFPTLEEAQITYTNVAENWDAFVEDVKSRGFFDKVSDIVNGSYGYDEKEKMLRSSDYRREVIEVCIENRNCLITMVYTIPAPYINNAGFKVCCVRNSGRRPEDVKSKKDQYDMNNQMVSLMKKGKYVEAFEICKQITLTKPEFINNKAVLLSFLGDYTMAKYYFDMITDLESHNYNLALMYMMMGDSETALEMIGYNTNYNSMVLIMEKGEYDTVIELSKESGFTDAMHLYLRAIAYTQTQESDDLVLFTLRQACSLDSSFKNQAKCQVEFMPLQDNEVFQDIVK